MKLSDTYQNLLEQCQSIAQKNVSSEALMQEVCELLHQELEVYNWVGFYLSNDEEKMLHLGPYAGATTDHVKIPYGKGICGQTAESKETFIVDDVAAEDNYIACSIDVKSEIVVPMFNNGQMIGQIDIDSHHPAAFNEQDNHFLQEVCQLVAKHLA